MNGNCALLGYYAGSSGNSLPKFRDNLSGSPSRVKGYYSPRNSPEERSSHLLRDGSFKSRNKLNVSDLDPFLKKLEPFNVEGKRMERVVKSEVRFFLCVAKLWELLDAIKSPFTYSTKMICL